MSAPSSVRTRPLTVGRTMDSGARGGGGLSVTDGVVDIRGWCCQPPSGEVGGSRARAGDEMVNSGTGPCSVHLCGCLWY